LTSGSLGAGAEQADKVKANKTKRRSDAIFFMTIFLSFYKKKELFT
jgi:hypothetical protein